MNTKDIHKLHELDESSDVGKGIRKGKGVSVVTLNVYFRNLKKI